MNIGIIATVGKAVFSTATKVGHVTVQHSPEICVGLGIVGGVTTTVMACKATLKVNEVCLENAPMYEKIEEALLAVENNEISKEEYSEEDAKKDRITLATYTGKEVIKNYAPVLFVGAASVACILCGMNILNKRNMMLVAAYTSLDAGFKQYRGRVVAELGEDADFHFRTGTVNKKIEMEVVDEETGEIKKKKVKADVLEAGTEPLDYTINFCEEAIHILDRKNIPRSLSFIESVTNSLDTILKAQGYLTLNQARVSLGVPEVWYGQIVGWTLDGTGDGYVFFNPKVVYDEELEDRTILLDPNVDGPMFHKIGG